MNLVEETQASFRRVIARRLTASKPKMSCSTRDACGLYSAWRVAAPMRQGTGENSPREVEDWHEASNYCSSTKLGKLTEVTEMTREVEDTGDAFRHLLYYKR